MFYNPNAAQNFRALSTPGADGTVLRLEGTDNTWSLLWSFTCPGRRRNVGNPRAAKHTKRQNTKYRLLQEQTLLIVFRAMHRSYSEHQCIWNHTYDGSTSPTTRSIEVVRLTSGRSMEGTYPKTAMITTCVPHQDSERKNKE